MRHVLVFTLLCFGAEAATQLDLTAPLVQEAAAADFTGRIKRIRIKKRRANNGFRVVTRTQIDSGNAATSATIAITDRTTGEVLYEGSESSTCNASGHHAAALSDLFGSEDLAKEYLAAGVGLQLKATSLTDGDLSFDPVVFTQDENGDSDWVEGAHASGVKFRARLRNGELRVVTLHKDATWLPITLTDLTADFKKDAGKGESVGSGAVFFTYSKNKHCFEIDENDISFGDNNNNRITTTVTVGDGSTLEVTPDGLVEIKETLGTIEASDDAVVLPGGDAPEIQLERINLRDTNSGAEKLVVYTSSRTGELGTLEAQLVDEETGEFVLDAIDETPVQRTRVFAEPGLSFDGGVSELSDATYLLLLDFFSEEGEIVGPQREIKLTLDGVNKEGNAAGDILGTFDVEGGLGKGTVVYEEAGTLGLVLEWSGDDAAQIASASFTFEEPFEGPPPLETEVRLDFAYEIDKWVLKSSASITDGATAKVTIHAFDATGAAIDSYTTTGASQNARVQNSDPGYLEKDYLDVLSEQATDEEDNSDE